MAQTFGTDPPLSKCPEPIAIVGMGCRWPGGVSSAEQLWDLLEAKRSGYKEFAQEKLNLDGYYHPDQSRPGSLSTRGGFFLEDNPKSFDHTFFGVTPTEVMTMDPTQRKLLEVVYEAFENAGEPWETFSGSRTGVFVGNFNIDHQIMQTRDADHSLPYASSGGSITILSNRISYVFNLKGPSLTLDTACSASLYALHLAVSSIRNGDCDSAIVAGSNLILGPDAQLLSVKFGALSPSSTCHTFDATADGYARAEGFGALYLKRVSDAVAGGYPIRAVVRGTAINANGRTGGISHPSPEGQEAVVRQAYKNAGGLDPNLTGYFECHGTGTPVGDPLEISAVGRVFSSGRQERPLLIGAIKPNIGHSESASGIAGVMKVVLALEHGQIPPTIGLVNPNPNIDFNGSRVKVVTEMTPWPPMPIRRASVNSFGYGGANAHCIIEHISSIMPQYSFHGRKKNAQLDQKHLEIPNGSSNGALTEYSIGGVNGPPSINDISRKQNAEAINGIKNKAALKYGGSLLRCPELFESDKAQTRRLVLLAFSGHGERSLKSNISMMAGAVDEYALADIAFTLSTRRSKFVQRAFAIADASRPASSLDDKNVTCGKSSGSQLQQIGFLFTGQGAQWAGMGIELFTEYEVFRNSIRYQDSILAKLSKCPIWTIEDVVMSPVVNSPIQKPEFSQTICTALQIALVDLLRSWSVEPAATVGHSSGEIAAAYAAGYHTAADGIISAYFRGQTIAKNSRDGRMLAVGLGPEQVQAYLQGLESDVKIAAINSPESVTLSGETALILNLDDRFQNEKIFSKVLKTGGNAYHSHHMLALGESYESMVRQGIDEITPDVAAEEEYSSPKIWISSVDPQISISRKSIDPSYWRKNLESPVHFSEAVETMIKRVHVSLDLLIEIGPHPVLEGLIKRIGARAQEGRIKMPKCLVTLRRGQDALQSMLTLAGRMFLENASINLAAVNATDFLGNKQLQLAHGSVCVDLPSYAYDYGPEIYHENRFSKELRLRKCLRHDLLGARQPGGAKGRPSWRNMLRMKDTPWLDDHKLLPHAVFPAAGYITMAVEAASQLHYEATEPPEITGFLLRSVTISSTLQVPDDELGIETILNMQAVSLTASKNSSRWLEFKISSVFPATDIWTEHCFGLISVDTERKANNHASAGVGSRLRMTDIGNWYAKFAEKGLGYGPAFQGLSDLRAYRGENLATANVALNPTSNLAKTGESSYPLHPATLDTCLQLALIAMHAGQAERFRFAFVPILMHEISIWIPSSQEKSADLGYGVATGELRGLRGGYAQTRLFSKSGAQLLEVGQIRCVAFEGSQNQDSDICPRDPYLRLVWKPDIDTLTNEQAKAMFPPSTSLAEMAPLFEEFDRLATYMIIQFSETYVSASQWNQSAHLQKFLSWIQRCFTSAKAEKLPYASEALLASADCRSKVIDRLSIQLGHIVEIRLVKKIYDNLPAILSNEISGLQVALQDNLLTELYTSGLGIVNAYPQLIHMIDLMAHKNPRMRILEIGAGTGGATRLVLNALAGDTNFKRYEDYTFTDITTSFLSSAQSAFSAHRSINFKTLDIEKDPLVQGHQPVFDLIIASDVMHAASRIEEAVLNVRKLLRPGGRLVIVELTRVLLGSGILLGTFPDYWKDEQEGRKDSPLLEKSAWHKVLLANGFSGIDILLDDYPEPISAASVIVTTAIEQQHIYPIVRPVQRPCIYIVYRVKVPVFANTIADVLQENSIDAVYMSLIDARMPSKSRIISVVDIPGTLLTDASHTEFAGMKEVVHRASSLLWISAGSLIKGAKPETAIMLGMLRTIATEIPMGTFSSIDLEVSFDQSSTDLARMIMEKEQKNEHTTRAYYADREFVLDSGCLHVSRLVPDKLLNDRFNLQGNDGTKEEYLPIGIQGPIGIGFKHPGLLSSLFFKPDPQFSQSLKADWIEIKTAAIGLNMKDLGVATGRIDLNNFSSEFSGVVQNIGKDIKNLKCGDRVYGLAPGNFGNFVRAPAATVQKMSPTDKFEEMASLPIAYMTAIHALIYLARLSKGETVLIQYATGGLGLAALRIARYLNAEIYATVGNAEKVQTLIDEFGVAEDHIFSSRETSAVSKLMNATGNRGIDVILCSTGGELLHETWRCIAPMGRFIDVGRVDVIDHGKLNLEIFQRNATFSSFDLALVYLQNPFYAARLMTEMDYMYRKEIVRPIDFIKTFDISNLEQALIYFASGKHMGKIVVTFEEPQALLKISPSPSKPSFNPAVNYLLAGCLGGLGRAISTWMVEHGARHLAFLSRSGSYSEEADLMIQDLRKRGTVVEVIKCDILSKEEVVAGVEQASRKREIKGVVHAAMVLEDLSFEKITRESLQRVLGPKVRGTINLHEATLGLELEFFTMTSSVVPMIASATQASYCAANSFQDAFARYRLSQGLPAQSMAFGLILEVGLAAHRPDIQQSSQRNGLYGTGESEFLRLLEASFVPQPVGDEWQSDPLAQAHLLTGLEASKLVDAYQNGTAADFHWSTDARFGNLLQRIDDLSYSRSIVKKSLTVSEEIDTVTLSERRELVMQRILYRLAKLLFLPVDEIDATRAVSHYGMDSMIAAELRNWLMKTFQTDISFLELLNPQTLILDLVERSLARKSIKTS